MTGEGLRSPARMKVAAALAKCRPPRGWRDFYHQLVIWFGFFFSYEFIRGVSDHNTPLAFSNAFSVIHFERWSHSLFELELQKTIGSSGVLLFLTSWTYWMSELPLLAVTLFWVYFRRYDAFIRYRNWVLLTNTIGLAIYAAVPMAPPWMFPGQGFGNTLKQIVTHQSGFVQVVANQYAAMPSLHAADSLIVGVVMARVVRRRIFKVLWLLWPPWVSFAVMATGNHYWVDVIAGIGVAALAVGILNVFYRWQAARAKDRERLPRPTARPTEEPAVPFNELPVVGGGPSRSRR
jgi:membrane-associated phospholipid phosphatase